ncbi:MAG: hypothetical protein ACYDDA_03730 [Acidiferrobacteraceae bacterium]
MNQGAALAAAPFSIKEQDMRGKIQRVAVGRYDIPIWNRETRTNSVVTCYVEMDARAVAEKLARKAIGNKKSMSRICHGAIAVKIA